MTWQIYLLVAVIFLTGAAYGIFLSAVVIRYSRKHSSAPISSRSDQGDIDVVPNFLRTSTTWRHSTNRRHWIGDKSELRLPTEAECSRTSSEESHVRLRAICSKLYGV